MTRAILLSLALVLLAGPVEAQTFMVNADAACRAELYQAVLDLIEYRDLGTYQPYHRCVEHSAKCDPLYNLDVDAKNARWRHDRMKGQRDAFARAMALLKRCKP